MAETKKDMIKPESKTALEETQERSNYVLDAWLVLVMALCIGAALTFIQISLNDMIEQNKRNETYSQIPNIVPGSIEADTKEETFENQIVYRAMSGENQVGWVVPAKGGGFVGDIEILIGLDAKAENLTGIYVLAQQETPGLGNKIIEEEWRSQYAGKRTDLILKVVKQEPVSEDKILSVTGATISSDVVTKVVNDTVAKFKSVLEENTL